ncbi:MAG: TlyA family RNA methyltransferase, partial [Oscillospiraceae bacterium]|nr:TlyA family RNA methyltransferase [Oscillospiraceae bacterium]
PAVQQEVLERFLDHAASAGFAVKDISFSPIKGPEGNIEFLGYLSAEEQLPYAGDLAALVASAHQLDKPKEEGA